MKRTNIYLVILAAMLLSGCGSTSAETVTEIDEIVGTWKSNPPALAIRIMPDGTVQAGVTVGKIEENAANEITTWDSIFSFEAGQLNIANFVDCHDSVGSYDVQLLPNGNMQFTIVEDDCIIRVSAFMGQRAEPTKDVEWIRVE
jgi:hypothetical protein